jgi:hypothetical protein
MNNAVHFNRIPSNREKHTIIAHPQPETRRLAGKALHIADNPTRSLDCPQLAGHPARHLSV